MPKRKHLYVALYLAMLPNPVQDSTHTHTHTHTHRVHRNKWKRQLILKAMRQESGHPRFYLTSLRAGSINISQHL